MSARPPRWPALVLPLALLSVGCDRLVNRLGREPAKACELGLVPACVRAALDAREPTQRQAFYARACELGSAPACVEEGALLFEAPPPRRNRVRAGELFARACAASVPLGCRNLSVHQDLEVHDRASAIASARRACVLGERESCWSLGAMREGVDRGDARQSFERSCSLGSVIGCGRLARHRVIHDPPAVQPGAVEPLGRACAEGDSISCYVLGVLQRDGVGGPDGPRDPAAAQRTFARGCELGEAQSCMSLGAMRFGSATPQAERVVALDLIQRACDLGALRACAAVGTERASGASVPRDVVLAERRLLQACEGGHALGCRDLGVFIRDGVIGGGPPRATEMFRRACAGGDTPACREAAPAALAPTEVAAPVEAERRHHRRRHH